MKKARRGLKTSRPRRAFLSESLQLETAFHQGNFVDWARPPMDFDVSCP